MSDGWQEAYSSLTSYVTGNPQIDIDKNGISIPSDVRSEFYRLFDTVRVAFLKEKTPALLDEAVSMSNSYKEVRDEIASLLGLSEVSVAPGLNWFLQDPANGLARELFHPLFDLLKGKIDTTIFERLVSRNIENSFKGSYQSGYEKWITLSLVKLLACDKAFAAPIPDIGNEFFLTESETLPGSRGEPVPQLKEMKRLTLGHGDVTALAIPDLIAHSRKIDKYVAIRTELTDARWTAIGANDVREWHSVSSIKRGYGSEGLWPDLAIYVDDEPENLALIADSGRFLRPDLIVECMEQEDWYQHEGLERIRLRHDVLKPRMGTYIVTRKPVPDQVYMDLHPASESAAVEPEYLETTSPQEQEPTLVKESENKAADIYISTVGFDQTKLDPIIVALSAI